MHTNFWLFFRVSCRVCSNEFGFLVFMYCYSCKYFSIFYALFICNLKLSSIIAINSLFVGFPFAAEMVYPKIFSTASCCPLPHAISIARLIDSNNISCIFVYVVYAINQFNPINIYRFYLKMFIGLM